MQELVESGAVEVKPIEEFEPSLKVLLRLARRQHQRVPTGTTPRNSVVRPSYYRPAPDA
jgi:hypothetical protein